MVERWFPFTIPGVIGIQMIPNEALHTMHTKIHPVDYFLFYDLPLDRIPLDIDLTKVTPDSYFEMIMGRERLRLVESSLYFYLELLKGGRLCFNMRFPFVNRRDWVDIIAETFKMDYQWINLNTRNPDKNIELLNISTEFYPLMSLPPDREDLILQLDPHSNMSFGNKNIIVTIRSTYEFPVDYDSLIIYNNVKQFWKGYIEFSSQNLIHVISLQGHHKEVSMQVMENSISASLNIYWLETTNQKFHSYRDVQFAHSWRNHICLKYITPEAPLDAPPSLDFAFIYQKYEKNLIYNGTWLEAYELCNHFDGFLPIFHSREVVDQFISVLKLPQVSPPPIKFIFIGLISHEVSKL